MSKSAFYFPHDSNARNDDKIIAVRMRHGATGYAVYFMILEKLLESTNYMSVTDYNIIAYDLRVGADIVKSVVEDFGLFQLSEDGKYFYSDRFTDRMRPLDNLREQRRAAGLKSAEARTKAQQKKNLLKKNSTTVERPLNDRSATVEQKLNKSDDPVERSLGKNSTEREDKSKGDKKDNTNNSFSGSAKSEARTQDDELVDSDFIPNGEKVKDPPPSSAAPPSTVVFDKDGIAICTELRLKLLEYRQANPSKYEDAMYVKFLRYWSEPNERGKPRWKTEKERKNGRFYVPGRLATWFEREKENASTTTKTTNRAGNSPLRPTSRGSVNYTGEGNVREVEI